MNVFPKAPHGKIAWVKLALGFDHFLWLQSHGDNLRKKRGKKLKDLFHQENVVVYIERLTEIVNGLDSFYPFNKTTESIKLDKSNSVLNYFENKKPGR